MWQDDAQTLGEAFHRASYSLRALLDPFPSALRRLTLLPSAIANAMPHPVWTLQILCAAVWLAQGLLAGWIADLLLPGRRWTRFVVVCLTLTATSDLTTGSMVALAYNVAALFLLAAVGWALIWLGRGQIIALAASAILLAISLLTMEVALPAVPFLALLFVWFAAWSGGTRTRAMMTEDLSATSASGRAGRGVAGLLVAWGIVLIPAGIVEWSFLRDPTSYAAMALVPVSKSVFVTRTIWLWSGNFAPWRWAFARPEWYAQAGCFANKTCQPTRFRYEELVMMDYDSVSGTWRLVRSLRDDPLARGHQSDAEAYRPLNRIIVRPWTVRQRHLLLRDK
jgi:hypothetical protein